MTATKRVSGMVLMFGAGLLGCTLAAGTLAGEQQAGSPPRPPNQGDARVEGLDAHGDPLPPGAVARLGTVRFRHDTGVMAVAFSPDGKAVASAGRDRSLVLHEASTGKKLRSFPGEATDATTEPYAVAFAPDGKTLAAAVGSRVIAVWEVATGTRVRQFQVAEGPVHYLALSHDGRTLAGGDERARVQVWDVRDGKEIGRIAPPETILKALAVAADGKTLAGALMERDVSFLALWDTASGRQLHRWPAHAAEVAALAFSPDGKRLASANRGAGDIGGQDQVRVWGVSTGQRQFELPGRFLGLRFSPDGKVLAAAAAESVSLCAADTGKEALRIPRGIWWLPGSERLAFCPEGKVLAVADPWTISLWDLATGKRFGPPLDGHGREVESIRFLPGGKAVASTCRDALYLWQLAGGRSIGRFEGLLGRGIDYRALSPDGKILAGTTPSESQTIGLWETATGKKLHDLQAPLKYFQYTLAFSPDGKTVAAAPFGGDRAIRLWDVVTGKPTRQLALPEAAAQSLAFSPDGTVLAAGEGDVQPPGVPKVRLLNAVTGRELRKPLDLLAALPEQVGLGFRVGVGWLAFSADGKTLAAVSTSSAMIQVWEVETGQVLRRLERPPAPAPESGHFALSPDGKSLVTAGATPRLWEVATGKMRGQLRGHSAAVYDVAFSPDGRLLVSGSQDTTALVWDAWNVNGEPPPATPLSAKELEALWANLAGADPAPAYRAMRALLAAPAQALPFLRQQLRPPTVPDPKHLARLIADLDAAQFEVREQAASELEKLGGLARPALRQVLAGQPSAETRQRVERLLQRPPQLNLNPEDLRGARATEVLEQVGTAEAGAVLEKVVREGPDTSFLVQDARAALERLRRRPVAP